MTLTYKHMPPFLTVMVWFAIWNGILIILICPRHTNDEPLIHCTTFSSPFSPTVSTALSEHTALHYSHAWWPQYHIHHNSDYSQIILSSLPQTNPKTVVCDTFQLDVPLQTAKILRTHWVLVCNASDLSLHVPESRPLHGQCWPLSTVLLLLHQHHPYLYVQTPEPNYRDSRVLHIWQCDVLGLFMHIPRAVVATITLTSPLFHLI